MDVSRPERALVPTLDGAVLKALSGTTGFMTAPQVHRVAGTGSVSGVRRTLARLVEEGLVLAEEAGQAWLYRANRDHLAWPAVEVLARLRAEFLDRLRRVLIGFEPACAYAGLFGSAARRDGTAASDIDLLLVRAAEVDRDEALSDAWVEQVYCLGQQVQVWTGNPLQVFDVSAEELATWPSENSLLDAWRADLVDLVGQRPDFPAA